MSKHIPYMYVKKEKPFESTMFEYDVNDERFKQRCELLGVDVEVADIFLKSPAELIAVDYTHNNKVIFANDQSDVRAWLRENKSKSYWIGRKCDFYMGPYVSYTAFLNTESTPFTATTMMSTPMVKGVTSHTQDIIDVLKTLPDTDQLKSLDRL